MTNARHIRPTHAVKRHHFPADGASGPGLRFMSAASLLLVSRTEFRY